MEEHGGSDETEVPLTLLKSKPSFVTGERAFVLRSPGVGFIEVGDPLPHENVWQHFEGDLMYTVVRDGSGGTSGGGGDTWDSPKVSFHMSEPGSGSDLTKDGWVVVGRIPEKFTRVRVKQGERTVHQQPIRGHVVVPLHHAYGAAIEIFGKSDDSSYELLFSFDGAVGWWHDVSCDLQMR